MASLAERWQSFSSFLQEHHVPPIVVPLFIIILLAVGGYYIFLYKPVAAEFRLVVQAADGARVNGALVEVYDGEKLLLSAESANGEVIFKNLPAKPLRFSISKRGVGAVEKSVDLSQRTTLRVELAPTASPTATPGPSKRGFKLSLTLVDSVNGTAVPGAKVVYYFGNAQDQALADNSGRVVLDVPKDTAIRIKVIHPDYKTADTTILSTKGVDIISLVPKKSGAAYFASAGILSVNALDEQNNPVPSGTVKAYDSASAVLITTGQLVGGKADLAINQGVKVTVSIDSQGFLPFASGSAIEVGANTPLIAKLSRPTPETSNTTRVNIVDEANAGVAATVYLVAYPGTTMMQQKSTGTDGKLDLTLTKDAGYYVIATAPGRVPNISDPFTAGANVTVRLSNANGMNSGNLTINVVDRQLNPVSGATVTLLSSSGLLFLPPASATSRVSYASLQGPSTPSGGDGRVVFTNLPLRDYNIRGKQGNLYNEVSLGFDSTQEITLSLQPGDAKLTVNGLDVSSNAPLPATYYAYDSNGNQTSTCDTQQVSTCTLTLPADESVTVVGTAPGYGNSTLTIDLTSGVQDARTIRFVPQGLLNQTKVDFLGVFDPTGQPTTLVRAGWTYQARFLVSIPDGVDRGGFYLRVGDAPNVSSDVAGIGEFTTAERVATSTTYNPGPNCSDLNNREGAILKWIELENSGSGQTFEVDAQIVTFDVASGTIPLHYRAYSVKGNAYSRIPQDDAFGLQESTSTLAGCYAGTQTSMLNVFTPGVATPPPTITADFSPSLKVWFDGTKLRSDIKEIALQIDPIFPADAVPLDLDPSDILAQPFNSTAGTQSCYHADFAKKVLTFESGDSNPSCPIKVVGNSIAGDESTSITFSSVKGPGQTITIPIRVIAKSVEPIQTFYLTPDSLSGDAAQLVYLVNEKQTGTRTINVAHPSGEKQLAFSQPDVQVLAWRGPGELSVGEGNASLGSLQYSYVASYFPAKKGIGKGAVLSRDCDGFLCCSRGWCTTTAVEAAVNDFQGQAKSIAAQTAFRRGPGIPWKYFMAGKPFRFVTAMQLKEGATLPNVPTGGETGNSTTGANLTSASKPLYQVLFDALDRKASMQASPQPPANVPTTEIVPQAQSGCVAGTPKVYTVAAQSLDGQVFAYTATTARLYPVDYVTGACAGESIPEAGNGTTVEGGYVPLCGFLFGDGQCVRRSKTIDSVTGPAGPGKLDENDALTKTLLLTLAPLAGAAAIPLLVEGGKSLFHSIFSSPSGGTNTTSGGGTSGNPLKDQADAAAKKFEEAVKTTDYYAKLNCEPEYVDSVKQELRDCYAPKSGTTPINVATCLQKLILPYQLPSHQDNLQAFQDSGGKAKGSANNFLFACADRLLKRIDSNIQLNQIVKNAQGTTYPQVFANCINVGGGSHGTECQQVLGKIEEVYAKFQQEFTAASECEGIKPTAPTCPADGKCPLTPKTLSCFTFPKDSKDNIPDELKGKARLIYQPTCDYRKCWFEGKVGSGWIPFTTDVSSLGTSYDCLDRTPVTQYDFNGKPTVFDPPTRKDNLLQAHGETVDVCKNPYIVFLTKDAASAAVGWTCDEVKTTPNWPITKAQAADTSLTVSASRICHFPPSATTSPAGGGTSTGGAGGSGGTGSTSTASSSTPASCPSDQFATSDACSAGCIAGANEQALCTRPVAGGCFVCTKSNVQTCKHAQDSCKRAEDCCSRTCSFGSDSYNGKCVGG